MSQNIITIESRILKDVDAIQSRNRQLAERAQDLASHARVGYSLVHTHVIETTDCAIFVDTLTRVNED